MLASLDQREKGGYARHMLPVELGTGSEGVPLALTYVATPDNPDYLGPAGLHEIASQVLRAAGPSGENVEYVVRLAAALREMDADDPHVFALEDLLRARRDRSA